MLKNLALSLTIFSVVSCSDFTSHKSSRKGSDKGQLSGQEYIVVQNDGLTNDSDTVSGSGLLVFKAPIAKTQDAANFVLNFSLEDGGSLELVAFANAALDSGITLKLQQDAKVLNLLDSGETTELKKIAASTETEVSIDIHTDEKPAHILVWEDVAEAGHEEHAAYNSEESPKSKQEAQDHFWGLRLNKALVKRASVGEAKVEHEHEHGHEH